MFLGGGGSGTFVALLSLLLGPFVSLFVRVLLFFGVFLLHCLFVCFPLRFRCINLCVLLFSFISDILFAQEERY